MEIMKNLCKVLFLMSSNLLLCTLNAQSTKVYDFFYEKYWCENKDGTIEYLKIDWDNKKIFYSSNLNTKDVPLTILNPETNFLDCLGQGTKVRFPNDHKVYQLNGTCSCANMIICTNPDNTKQEFSFIYGLVGDRGTFRCINPNKSIEYLYLSYTNSKNIRVKYSSTANPKWVDLVVSNIVVNKEVPVVFLDYEDILSFDVQFPNLPQKYKIVIPNGEEELKRKFPIIYVINPDGSKQTFQWINKE